MLKRIDRFVEKPLIEFADWYAGSEWCGKVRDCVNIYAHMFLCRDIQTGEAIQELSQIRIEGPVPQPSGYKTPTAAKDLVIWRYALDTAWNEEWEVVDWPRLVMEWKFDRSANPPSEFDSHDLEWLHRYTREYDETFGYLVRVHDGPRHRSVDWAKIVRGELNDTNKRS